MSKQIAFAKMHGAGNDFIVIDDLADALQLDGNEVEALCRRRRGIGADGLIVIKPSSIADFKMEYFNRDGGEAEMCGNGARCAALFARLFGIAGDSMAFETLSGLVEAELSHGRVTVRIGDVTDLELAIRPEGIDQEIHFALSGVPHAAILNESASGYDDEAFAVLAERIRHHRHFAPNGTNVNLATVRRKNVVSYRTYERGVEAETEACGTGAVAVAVITAHLGLTSAPVLCETSGGDVLEVDFEMCEGGARNCRLSGPAVFVFKGTVELDERERV
jgi:diaminopimelate epimerase